MEHVQSSPSLPNSEIASKSLCPVCNKTVLKFFRKGVSAWHESIKVQTHETLQNSRASCPLCQLIVKFWLSSGWQGETCEPQWCHIYVLGLSPPAGFALHWPRDSGSLEIAKMQFSADLLWAARSSHEPELVGAKEVNTQFDSETPPCVLHSIKGNSGSLEVMQILKTWMSFCNTNHACRQNLDQSPLPTRVIDVGPADGSNPPYLLDSSGMRGTYVTLSHSWGGDLKMKLLSSNFADYHSSILEHTLPATFRDAVKVTRNLGFRYIWIDALCILQDCANDWEREAASMADIYKNCRLMLSALDSRNSDSGLFRNRDEAILFEVSNAVSRSCGLPGGVRAHLSHDSYTAALNDGALSKRGWTLQEFLFAPIVVHFSHKQVFWDCQQMQVSEDGQLERVVAKHSTITTRISRFNVDKTEAHIHWYRLVEQYTSRSLTVDTDRLPAVIGLAKEYEQLVKDIYVNGLWKKDLERGILWNIPGDNPDEVGITIGFHRPELTKLRRTSPARKLVYTLHGERVSRQLARLPGLGLQLMDLFYGMTTCFTGHYSFRS